MSEHVAEWLFWGLIGAIAAVFYFGGIETKITGGLLALYGTLASAALLLEGAVRAFRKERACDCGATGQQHDGFCPKWRAP